MGEDRVDRLTGGGGDATDNRKPAKGGHRLGRVGGHGIGRAGSGSGGGQRAEGNLPEIFIHDIPHEESAEKQFLGDRHDHHQPHQPQA